MCSLKYGTTALMPASFKSPDIVEALLKGKANVEARDNVRHLEGNRCAACLLIAHLCVFVEGQMDSSDAGIIQIP